MLESYLIQRRHSVCAVTENQFEHFCLQGAKKLIYSQLVLYVLHCLQGLVFDSSPPRLGQSKPEKECITARTKYIHKKRALISDQQGKSCVAGGKC